MNDIRLNRLEQVQACSEIFFAFAIYKKMYLSLKEAQEYLGIKSYHRFLYLIEKGDLPAIKMGRNRKISLVDLDNFLKIKKNMYYES